MSETKFPWAKQLLNNGLSMLNPGGDRLQILIYHRVLSKFDPLQPDIVTKDLFEEQIRLISRFYRVLSFPDAIRHLKDNTLPPKSICITFDDGYRDNAENALPILEKYNVVATFFVSTGFLHGRAMFNDRIIEYIRDFNEPLLNLSDYSLGHYHTDSLAQKFKTIGQVLTKLKHLPFHDRIHLVEQMCGPLNDVTSKLMMRPHQIKLLKEKGMEIGAHTVNHPILSCMPLNQAKEEITASKEELEQLLGTKVNYFAYPNGKLNKDYGLEHVDWVRKCGFKAAVSTTWGTVSNNSDLFQLPRFTPWDKNPYKFMLRLVQYRHKEIQGN
jgi:peptidoglycan/xylan/chitin deacetylase (PgdA/CDA1 family)